MGLMRRAPLPIDLDFSAGRRETRWYGWVLLAAGVAALGFAFTDYRAQQAELAERQVIITRLRDALARSAPAPRAGTGRDISPEEAKAALDVATRLNAGWGTLFAGLAAAQSDDATWIFFDGDGGRNSLRITADARNLAAVFEFLERLGRAPGIHDVRLSSYEWTSTEAVPVVRFHASAAWRTGQ